MRPLDALESSVREALLADAARIVALARQLGYEVPIAHIEYHLKKRPADRAVFVAVVPRAGVVGWIEVAQAQAMLAPRSAEIEGLIVEDEYRGNGIGEALVRTAQSWARRHACARLVVRSNVLRERAHGFYTRLGFALRKTQRVLECPL